MEEFKEVPRQNEIIAVLQILYNNGINVTNPESAYQELKQYESNSSFCMILSYLFHATECPVANLNVPGSWLLYRYLAGITLKNNLARAQHLLGESAVKSAAVCALYMLRHAKDHRLLRVAAQIVVQDTLLTSFNWWVNSNIGNLSYVLLYELLPLGDVQTYGSLYTLQYLMEDVSKEIGAASEEVISRVTEVILGNDVESSYLRESNDLTSSSCVNNLSTSNNISLLSMQSNFPLELRKAAFKVCLNVYEQASFLDWNVDTLSPWQQGLTNASWNFAQACTSLLRASCNGDEPWLISTLRACLILLDYFEYFKICNSNVEKEMSEAWCTQTVEVICAHCVESCVSGNEELIAAAIDLISSMISIYDECGGEGAATFLVTPISSLMNKLLPSLVQFAILADDEVEAIMSNDDYRIRDTKNTSSRKYSEKGEDNNINVNNSTRSIDCNSCNTSSNHRSCKNDIVEDDLLDDETAAMTLRSSALKCIETLCLYDTNQTFPLLIREIQRLWNQSEWKQREVGIVLIGTIANGCASQLEQCLSTLITQLIEVVGNSSEHVCVVSIAMWSLSRLSESVLAIEPSYMDQIVEILTQRLQSPSKRIQLTSISALNVVFANTVKYQRIDLLQPKFQQLLTCISVCLPVYTTGNLSLLIDLLNKIVMFASNNVAMTNAIKVALQTEQVQRAKEFEETYAQVYVHNIANSLINKDIFHIERGLLVLWSLIPHEASILSGVSTWSNILHDMLSRGIDDDFELIYSTIYVICGYLRLLSTNTMNTWLASPNLSLFREGFCALQSYRCKSLQTQQAAVMLLTILSKTTYTQAVNEPRTSVMAHRTENSNDSNAALVECETGTFSHNASQHNSPVINGTTTITTTTNNSEFLLNSNVSIRELISYCAALLTETDNTMFKTDLIQLIVAVILYQLPQQAAWSAEVVHFALSAINNVLRSDVFGDTLYMYVTMSYNICTLLNKYPRLISTLRADVICQLLTQAENLEEKANATVALSNAVMNELQTSLLAELLPHYLRLVYSWQQSAFNYEGVVNAITSVIHQATRNCLPLLQQLLYTLPPQFRQLIVSNYNINI